MKRAVLFAIAGAGAYAAFRAVTVYPLYKNVGQAVQNGVNPLSPMLWAAAVVGGVIGWASK